MLDSVPEIVGFVVSPAHAYEGRPGDGPLEVVTATPRHVEVRARPKRDDIISPERAVVNRMAELGARLKTPAPPDSYDGYIPDKSK